MRHEPPALRKALLILNMLVEGSSMRAISRVADVSINTVGKMLADAGEVCAKYHDEMVRNVAVRRVECDEVWSFCYAKQKTVNEAPELPDGAGDVWTWTAIDADTKLMLAYEIGDRSLDTGLEFLENLRERLSSPVHFGYGRLQCLFVGR